MNDASVVLVEQDLTAVLSEMRGSGLTLDKIASHRWIGSLDPDVAVTVDEGDYGHEGDPPLVAISFLSDIVDEEYVVQRSAARRAYDGLASRTGWRLELRNEDFDLVDKRPALRTT